MAVITKTFQYGNHTVTIETGKIARQATAAVTVNMDDTVVLVTVVAKTTADGNDFFPLTVNYFERAYSAGRIPGGFLKRESKPSDRETLIARLIDRPLRPLFPEGFYNEVQIVATVMSLNPEVIPDIPAMIGASAVLSISGLPFNGPMGAARVAYQAGGYILNPTASQLKNAELDLVIAGNENAVFMVESEAQELPEEVMLGAVWYGHEQSQAVIKAIKELREEVGTVAWEWQPPAANLALNEIVANKVQADLIQAYQTPEKLLRQNKISELRDKVVAELATGEEGQPDAEHVKEVFSQLESNIVRGRILDGFPRIDGRDTRSIRPITVETGILPRTHGSALFTRGETQAIVVTTLGNARDAQTIDSIEGESKDNFMLHYNFPPYSVGETGQVGAPKRREIGHGRLAKRAVAAVLPTADHFPYVIRVVSEITESNGSSSMASVCGASLALMDAGVPVKAPVAGIAMGLIKEGNKFAVLSDILGDEDHLGDMDFKVAGTAQGVTALQMDIKTDGITKFIMAKALEQAREGRMHILQIMNAVIHEPRAKISEFAPSILKMKIHPDKIRDVIGKGGATIRAITEETGVNIDIQDDGSVSIFAVNAIAGKQAIEKIQQIISDVEPGTIYQGKVVKLMDFGAFVNLLPGKDGFVHISQISEEHVENIADKLQEGQIVTVKVIEIDRQGRVRLSMKPSEIEPVAEKT